MKHGRTFFLTAVLLLLSQIIAFGKTYPWSWLPFGFGRLLWFFFSLVFLALIFKQAFFLRKKPSRWNEFVDQFEKKILMVSDSKGAFVALIGLNVVFQTLNFIKFQVFGYHFPFFCLCVCFLAVFLMTKDRLLTAFALNIALLVGSIIHFPLTGFRSDMLLVIRQGLDFWAVGKDPYYELQYPWGVSGMTYFPGILFSHVPAWVLGIDLRWDQVLFRTAWTVLLYQQVRSIHNSRAVVLLILFVLSPYVNFRHDLYFEVFLLLLALWSIFSKARFIIIPLLAVTWQFGWALCPFLVWEEIFHTGEQTIRNRIKRIARLTGGFVVVIVFVLLLLHGSTTFRSFLSLAFFVVNPKSDLNGMFVIDYGLTLAPLFIWSGLEKYAFMIEVLGGLTIFAYYINHRNNKPDVFWFCTLSAIIFFVMTEIHFWQYFWIFPIFWTILGLLDNDKRVPA